MSERGISPMEAASDPPSDPSHGEALEAGPGAAERFKKPKRKKQKRKAAEAGVASGAAADDVEAAINRKQKKAKKKLMSQVRK